VIVKGPVKLPLEFVVTDAENIPLPIFVSVAGPLTVVLAPNESVAFVTVNVVLIVPARAAHAIRLDATMKATWVRMDAPRTKTRKGRSRRITPLVRASYTDTISSSLLRE
jgi:flagellar biogenesis protein FliO